MAAPYPTLRRLARSGQEGERCDLCGAGVPEEHRHLLERGSRTLRCACYACALLFQSQSTGRYRLIPTRVRLLEGFQLSDEAWDELLIPVGLAFFVFDSAAGRVICLYPSPAGATQCNLGLEAWQDLEAANPVLRSMEPDVEALLVNRVGESRQYLIVPIDECYRLTGIVRSRWHGLSGGAELWGAVAVFFAQLTERAEVVVCA